MSLPHLRPLSAGEILDGAFSLYRRHFALLFLVALVPALPTLAVSVWAHLTGAWGAENDPLAGVVVLPFWLAEQVLVNGCLTWLASAAYLGGEVSPSGALRETWRRAGSLLTVLVLSMTLFTVGLMLLVVPGVMVMIAWFAVVPAVMLEGCGYVRAQERSRALAKGAWRPILAVAGVLTLITALPQVGMWMLPDDAFADAVGSLAEEGRALALQSVLVTVTTALTYPVLAIGTVLLYYDRRVRSEGLDLQAAADGLATA